MILLNLNVLPEKDVAWQIKQTCGGKYSLLDRLRRKGIGIGGLYYLNGHKEVDEHRAVADPLRANLEVFRSGYGIYLRSSREHLLILIHNEALNGVDLFEKSGDKSSLGLIDSANDGTETPFLQLEITDIAGEILKMRMIKQDQEQLVQRLKDLFGIHRFTDHTNK